MEVIKTYIKKPVRIEAIQWLGGYQRNIIEEWSKGNCIIEGDTIKVNTLNGFVYAEKGEWIIKGIENEYYPCKDIIFKKLHIELE